MFSQKAMKYIPWQNDICVYFGIVNSIYIPKRLFNEDGIVYASFSTNNDTIRRTSVLGSISHNSTCPIDRISPVIILNRFIILSTDNFTDFSERFFCPPFPHNPTNISP